MSKMYRIRRRVFNIFEAAFEHSKCRMGTYVRDEQLKRNLSTVRHESIEDTFGLLSKVDGEDSFYKRDINRYEKETDDNYKGLRNSVQIIKSYIYNNQYEKAVAELKVIEARRKAPQSIYRLLISYKAEHGDVEEVFHLYNELKRRSYIVHKAVYTSLFTACRNCPRTEVALPIANKVLINVVEKKEMVPNYATFNAILKAFGKHGDMKTFLQVFDLASSFYKGKLPLKTYDVMLQACLNDVNSGLRFAILIWHKMLHRLVKPDLYTFGSLLHCVKECRLGDIYLLQGLINEILKIRQREVTEKSTGNEDELLGSGSTVEDKTPSNKVTLELCESPDRISDSVLNRNESMGSKSPNLLDIDTISNAVIKIADFSKPENRLALLGGVDGLLEMMSRFSVKPDVIFFTLLLRCISPTIEAETKFLQLLSQYKLKADVRFYNELLQRKLIRNEKQTVEDYLNLLKEKKIKPDAYTFGILARSCKNRESGMMCIEKAREAGIRLNSVILTNLLERAVEIHDLKYISEILTAAKRDQVKLNMNFITILKDAVQKEKQYAAYKESNTA